MKPVNIKIFGISLLSVSIIYWFLTILYCSPDNFIKVQSRPLMNIFETLFYQKWNFFAPPPTINTRLYFYYFDEYGSQISTVEAIQSIAENKAHKVPFNSNEQFLDYSVTSAIVDIKNYLLDRDKTLKYITNSDKNKNSSEYREKYIKESLEHIYKESSFKNLVNYSKIVKNKNEFLSNAKSVKIVITEIHLPKFIDRKKILDTNYKPEEDLVIASDIIKY